MKILNKLLVITFLLCGFASASQKLNLEETTLSNGLKVIVMNTKSNGVVFIGVGYFVGSGDDPRNVVGISHVLEHMMFKGTKNMSGDDLKKTIFIYNKYSNAFTNFDMTVYIHTSNKSFMDVNLQIEADRMRNLKLDKKALASEKEVIKEERKMRTESDPLINHMEEAAWKSMYLFSNYSYPIIGYMDQIDACSKDEVKKHYKKFYKPNNAFVLIVGDITMKEALPKVKKYFGNIKKGKEHKRDRVIDPEDTGLSYTMEHEAPNISVHNLNLIYKIDRKLFDDLKKLMTVDIAVSILSSGLSSVLYQHIVDKKQIAYNIQSMLDVRAFDKGRLNIATVFKEDQKDSDVESEITAVVSDYAGKYLTTGLFEREKQKILDNIEMKKDNPQEMGMFIIGHLITGYKLSEIDDIKNIINSIKFEDVKTVAAQIFTNKNRIMRIYSHPRKD